MELCAMIMDLSCCGLFNKHLSDFFKSLFTFLYTLALLIFCPLNYSVPSRESWGGHYHC